MVKRLSYAQKNFHLHQLLRIINFFYKNTRLIFLLQF